MSVGFDVIATLATASARYCTNQSNSARRLQCRVANIQVTIFDT